MTKQAPAKPLVGSPPQSGMGDHADAKPRGRVMGRICDGSCVNRVHQAVNLSICCAAVGLIWLLLALNMRVPAPAPNLAVEIGRDEQQRKTVLERLREWPEVLDITVIAGEPVIYIKVASDFDRRRLDELISV